MSEPPKFAEWLLRRLVGGRDADAVAGDLRETFEARDGGRLWYWWQALSCMAVRFSLYRRALPGIGTDFGRAVRRGRSGCLMPRLGEDGLCADAGHS